MTHVESEVSTTMASAEQDDDILDNWEDIEENPAVLEERLEKLALERTAQAQSRVHGCDVPIVTCEDSGRTPFTPQEPKIMILRRPQAKSDQSVNGMITAKQKQPVKTLEQCCLFFTMDLLDKIDENKLSSRYLQPIKFFVTKQNSPREIVNAHSSITITVPVWLTNSLTLCIEIPGENCTFSSICAVINSNNERQQEYAVARLRILGDSGDSEDGKPKPIQQKSLEQGGIGLESHIKSTYVKAEPQL
ncbi:uncharacterized protein LOC135209312 [Macrobrachium nipponense]|uniref:uncharacterized protein LOC135209312 n=1 Tax=Macrobrachium nipponense TaxID=159736 RepID=UPI0030C7F5E7